MTKYVWPEEEFQLHPVGDENRKSFVLIIGVTRLFIKISLEIGWKIGIRIVEVEVGITARQIMQ